MRDIRSGGQGWREYEGLRELRGSRGLDFIDREYYKPVKVGLKFQSD